MKIDKIKLKNLKGVTREYDLSDSNLIYGDNGSGKTAILDCMRLACLGYHPKLGKTGSKIFSLSSSNEMSASVIFSDGETSEFVATSNNGSVSKDWQGKELEDAVKIQLDPNIFFSTTQNEKNQKIFALLTKEEKNSLKQRIVAEINATESEKTDLEIEIISNFSKIVEEILDQEDSPSLALQKMQELSKEYISQARENLNRSKKTIESHATNTDFMSALLKDEEYYSNLESELHDKKHKVLIEKNEREKLVDEISNIKQEIDSLNEAILKASTDHKEKQILKEHEELEKEFNKQYKILQNDILKLSKELEKATEVNELAKDSSYENFCESAPHGTYVIEVEVLKDGDGISNTIWSASPFGISEKSKELSKKENNLRNLKDAFDSESKMLLYKLEVEKDKKTIIDESRITILEEQLSANQKKLETFRNWKTIEEEIDAILGEQERLQANLKKARELEFQKNNGVKLRQQCQEFELELTILRRIQKSLKELTESISNTTLAKLLNPMNLFAKAIDLPEYNIVEGKIGYTDNGRIVDYSSFSGSELAVFKVAVSVALAMQGMMKLAIIDELGRFDETRKRKTLLALDSFVKNGILNQFICVDVISPISINNLNLISTNEAR